MCVFTLASLSYRQALLVVALLHTSSSISAAIEVGSVHLASKHVTPKYVRGRQIDG